MPFLTIDWIEVSAIATGILAFGTFAFVVVAFLQRQDSSRSADAAQQAASASEASVALQGEMYAEQSRLATYPPVACDFFFDDTQAFVHISNSGTVPALDVDIIALALIHEHEISPADYVRENVKAHYQEQYLGIGTEDEGFFSVFDRICYSIVPPKRVVTAPLDFLEIPNVMVILIQFRDLLGRNYLHFWNVSRSPDQESSRYIGIMRTESGITESPRFDFIPHITEWPGLPDYVKREFIPVLKHRISSSITVEESEDIEERGVWSDL